MIKIKKSLTADSRIRDFSEVTDKQLLVSSRQHINDVNRGLQFFCRRLNAAGYNHDRDKLTNIDQFYADFKTKFEKHSWYDNHKVVNRHHLNEPGGVPLDVNLIDVIEYIVDCVMAGKARSGSVYDVTLDPDLLTKAFANTVELLTANVTVED